jgi:hypothetical protein
LIKQISDAFPDLGNIWPPEMGRCLNGQANVVWTDKINNGVVKDKGALPLMWSKFNFVYIQNKHYHKDKNKILEEMYHPHFSTTGLKSLCR